jgi:hypothetical protein
MSSVDVLHRSAKWLQTSWLIHVIAVSLVITASINGFVYLYFSPDEIVEQVGSTVYHEYYDPLTNDINKLPLVAWNKVLFKDYNIAFYTHISLGPIALLLGPLQLNPRLRRRYPKLHTYLGRLSMICTLASLPAGILLGINEYAGVYAAYGFAGMGLSVLICTLMGYYQIKSGM